MGSNFSDRKVLCCWEHEECLRIRIPFACAAIRAWLVLRYRTTAIAILEFRGYTNLDSFGKRKCPAFNMTICHISKVLYFRQLNATIFLLVRLRPMFRPSLRHRVVFATQSADNSFVLLYKPISILVLCPQCINHCGFVVKVGYTDEKQT
jgi:hypothetical protein